MRRPWALFQPAVFLLALLAGWYVSGLALAADAHRVIQKKRAFNLKQISILTGDALYFVNDDEFIHQVYVESRSFNFDTAESSPGEIIEIVFPVGGAFEVRCHIHPKMLLVVTVQ